MLEDAGVDNRFWDVDIFGSWIEVGMVSVVVAAGIMIALPSIIRTTVRAVNKKRSVWPCDDGYRKTHSRVHEFLTEIRIKSNASRSWVMQFHNGGNFLDGTSIKRFSLTHESCAVGVSDTVSSRQNCQASTFVELLDILTDPEHNGGPQLTSDLPDCHLKRHLEGHHTLIYSVVPLKDARGVLTIGALCVDWSDWDLVDEIDDEIQGPNMKIYAKYISGQLLDGAMNAR